MSSASTRSRHRLDIDGFDLITLGDRTFRLAQGFGNFVDTLAADFPNEREGLRQYVEALKSSDREQWDSLDPNSDHNPLFSPSFTTGAWDYLNTIIRPDARRCPLGQCHAHGTVPRLAAPLRLRPHEQ